MTRDELVAELARRYPDGSMPAGGGLALARELGMDIRVVAEARRAAGISVAARAMRPRPPTKRPPWKTRRWSNVPLVLAELEAQCGNDKRVLPGTFRAIGDRLELSAETVSRIGRQHGYVVTRDSVEWSQERSAKARGGAR